MITLTAENLNKCTKNLYTDCIALNRQQLKLLGVNWPPKKGWTKELIGAEIDNKTYDRLLSLKGQGRTQHTQIAKKKMVLMREVEKLGGKITWNN